LGAADTVSVVIRVTCRRRELPLINAFNQLCEFESGVTAAVLGAMPAALPALCRIGQIETRWSDPASG